MSQPSSEEPAGAAADRPARPGGAADSPGSPEAGKPVLLRVHRAPRMGRFLATGAVVGVVLGLLATISAHPADQPVRIGLSVMVIAGLVGGLLGGAVALVADRRRGAGSP